MGTRRIVTTIDDLDGTEGAATVRLALEDATWEVDLSPANREALKKALQPFLEAGRRVGPTHGGGKRAQPSDRVSDISAWAQATRVQLPARGDSRNALIRAWAAENGHEVPARGRIPSAVVRAYERYTASASTEVLHR